MEGREIRSVYVTYNSAIFDAEIKQEGVRMQILPVVHTGARPLYAVKYDAPAYRWPKFKKEHETAWIIDVLNAVWTNGDRVLMTDFSEHMPKKVALFDTIVDAAAEGMKRARLERVDAELIEGREEFYEEHGEVEKKVFTKPVANPLCDPEVRKQVAGPGTIAKMRFTCGETTSLGEGVLMVTIKPFCYHKNSPLWVVTYESDYGGVSSAYLVHCDPEMYDGMDYSIMCVDDLETQAPSVGMALFEDLTQAMLIGMRQEVLEEYARCVKGDVEYLRERGAEEAYLDAIS